MLAHWQQKRLEFRHESTANLMEANLVHTVLVSRWEAWGRCFQGMCYTQIWTHNVTMWSKMQQKCCSRVYVVQSTKKENGKGLTQWSLGHANVLCQCHPIYATQVLKSPLYEMRQGRSGLEYSENWCDGFHTMDLKTLLRVDCCGLKSGCQYKSFKSDKFPNGASDFQYLSPT